MFVKFFDIKKDKKKENIMTQALWCKNFSYQFYCLHFVQMKLNLFLCMFYICYLKLNYIPYYIFYTFMQFYTFRDFYLTI